MTRPPDPLTAAQIARLARSFWDEAGGGEPFPRAVELAVMHQSRLPVVAVPQLGRLALADEYRAFGLPAPPAESPARLLGCVLVYRERGAIYVDAGLDPAMRRAVVAHEFGHYLAEYRRPRDRVFRRLGESPRAALDGDRPPTADETLGAAMAGVRLPLWAHHLSRDYAGPADENPAERLASAVALELLAPRDLVLVESVGLGAPLRELLEGKYGLPLEWAKSYAGRLQYELAGRKRAAGRFGF